MQEVAPAATIFYKVIAQSENGPRLFRWTRFDRNRVDLTDLLRAKI